jgi:hypothetical protein
LEYLNKFPKVPGLKSFKKSFFKFILVWLQFTFGLKVFETLTFKLKSLFKISKRFFCSPTYSLGGSSPTKPFSRAPSSAQLPLSEQPSGPIAGPGKSPPILDILPPSIGRDITTSQPPCPLALQPYPPH